MLQAYDMIDLTPKERNVFVDQAIFTAEKAAKEA